MGAFHSFMAFTTALFLLFVPSVTAVVSPIISISVFPYPHTVS